ncbi:multidrug resistance-associated protein 1-like isoform 9-T9 [Chlamydotis macqueenii]
MAASRGKQGGLYERPRPTSKKKRSPEENVFFFSKLTYSWFSRLISIGYKKPLERDDLFELNEGDSPYSVCPNFEKQWRKEIQKSTTGLTAFYIKRVLFKKTSFHKPSLILPLWQTFKFLLVKVAFLKVTADILAFMSPQIMKAMIMASENNPSSYGSGYGYAIALFFVVLSQTLLHQLYQRNNMLTAVKIKTAVVGLIYKKALTLANSSRRNYTTGEIVNLMSADAQQLMELTSNINLLWSAPFQIIMAVIFLWKELGPSVLAGVAVLLLVIPINALIAAKVKRLKKSQMKYSDQRVKLLSEMLHGIKILKLYAWEPAYQRKVMNIREHEVDVLKSSGYLATYSMLTLTCIPFMVSLATFGIYFHLDKENVLTATKVFTAISLFNILRLPLFDLPSVISAVAQTKVSLSRLEDFLCAEDLNPEDVNTNYSGNHAVRFIGASFRWEKNGLPVLKHLSVSIPEGSLVAVVGQVGSGKSSFLSAILGEMEKLEGTVQRRGSVAYVSQQAWIQNDSLQENILFGANLNRPYYELVLESCALLPDLEQLLNGDQTEIGERGVNISGGQKQRVSLARAVYSNADLYLLDDPLSAVDVHVGKHLFEKLIGPSGLLKSKTRILVTHNLTLLPHTDLIIVMEEGRIVQMGTYQELTSKKANFTELIQVFSAECKREETIQMEVSSSKEEGQLVRSLQQRELLKHKKWLSVRLEFLGNLMVFFAALFVVLSGNTVSSSTVGLSISYALNIIQSLNFWVRKACEIETNAVSIERVCEYAKMDKEEPWIMSKRPPVGWPDRGIIEFVNYKAQYRKDLGLALNDLSFQTQSKEKVGIVGRTGAGKSTLASCLFRVLEGSEGKIIVDGIDISTIGLHDLRGNLNIIPQDPVLFSGTLQSNLDPLGKHSDLELWEVLELCDLKDFVQSLPKKLLHEISEGGENLSVGQRQLVCLARVLLRKTKILVLDEATASVDMETDNLVQSTIKREFYNCTILTIAHRLHTVMDSERVLVLDAGRILEYDTPRNLLQRKGAFSEMVAEAGIRT